MTKQLLITIILLAQVNLVEAAEQSEIRLRAREAVSSSEFLNLESIIPLRM